ncbi:MAG TPA: type IV pilin-like G/H family protein [Coleofasciculaceae cyanobacterium]|jgi:Tfp pilus assembly protein PilE
MQSHHKEFKGFKLLKLFVTGGITAILASNASPALSQVDAQVRAITDFEARIYIGSINRAQQVYYVENEEFANKLSLLGGYPSQTTNYRYGIVVPKGLSYPAAAHQARPKKPSNKAVIGGVALAVIGGDPIVVTLRCVANKSPAQGGAKGTELPIFGANGAISCPTGYRSI